MVRVDSGAKENRKRASSLRTSYFDGYEYHGLRVKVKLEIIGEGKYSPVIVSRPREVYNLFRRLQESDKDRLYSIHIDSEFRVIGVELIGQGPMDGVNVIPGDVFKSAIPSSASGIILVHSHPFGYAQQTFRDSLLINRLEKAGELLGIPVIDYVIVGRDCYYSHKLNKLPSRMIKTKEMDEFDSYMD
jgi:DNA repair protein RadC